jgi:hypothetical protein
MLVHEFVFVLVEHTTEYRLEGQPPSRERSLFLISLDKVQYPVVYACLACVFALSAKLFFQRSRRGVAWLMTFSAALSFVFVLVMTN